MQGLSRSSSWYIIIFLLPIGRRALFIMGVRGYSSSPLPPPRMIPVYFIVPLFFYIYLINWLLSNLVRPVPSRSNFKDTTQIVNLFGFYDSFIASFISRPSQSRVSQNYHRLPYRFATGFGSDSLFRRCSDPYYSCLKYGDHIKQLFQSQPMSLLQPQCR